MQIKVNNLTFAYEGSVDDVLENVSFNIDNKVINELDSIIKYIKAKGYNIVNIETLLSEKNLK